MQAFRKNSGKCECVTDDRWGGGDVVGWVECKPTGIVPFSNATRGPVISKLESTQVV